MPRSTIIWLSSLAWFLTIGSLFADDKTLIASGESLGLIHLGMDEEQVQDRLGKPAYRRADSQDGIVFAAWYSKPQHSRQEEIDIEFETGPRDSRQHIKQVSVTSPFFHTPAGNSTQSDLSAFWKEYPDLTLSATYLGKQTIETYDSKDEGIGLMVEHFAHPRRGHPWGKCLGIIVHLRGKGAATGAGFHF